MRLLALCAVCLMASAAQAQVQITGGWIHASPPFQATAPTYMSFRSEKDDALVSVKIDSGGTVQLEKSGPAGTSSGGALSLPAAKTVTLSPGGSYLALAGASSPLIPGSRVGLTLYFKNSPPETVVLNVLSRGDVVP